MAENEPGPDNLGQDARLSTLDARLKAAQVDEARRTGAGKVESDGGARLGNRVLAELIGGMVGGALIGWVIDRFAGTQPWGLIVLFVLGTGAAFRNIIRISSQPPK